MNLEVYVLRDKVSGISNVILTANNEKVLRRDIKGVLLGRDQNVINTNTEDKDIYHIGDLNTETGVFTSLPNPVFLFNVETVRLELVKEIRAKKEQAGIIEENQNDGTNN